MRRTAKLPLERELLDLVRGTVISPAMSLLKTMESADAALELAGELVAVGKDEHVGFGLAAAAAWAMAAGVTRRSSDDRATRQASG